MATGSTVTAGSKVTAAKVPISNHKAGGREDDSLPRFFTSGHSNPLHKLKLTISKKLLLLSVNHESGNDMPMNPCGQLSK